MKNSKLVPKLRFPEFRGDAWNIKALRSLADKVTTKNKDGILIRVLTNSAVAGVMDQRDFFDKDIANQGNLETYFVIDEGDYVYNPRISITAPVGPISKNKIGKGVISPLYTVFRFKNKNNDFFEQFFKTNLWHDYLKHISNMGARHDRMSVSAENFMNMPLPSSSEEEQQKIADCLSSLVELITSEEQKLEFLKAHKKGLMQKLFPVEEKTVPELRFPEFSSSEDWDTYLIRDFAKVITGNKDTQNKIADGKYPFFVRSQTVERINSYFLDCEAILTSGDGVGVGKNFHYVVGKFDAHQRVYCIYGFTKKTNGKFIFQYFSEHFNKRVMQLSAKNSVDSVRMAMITEMPIRIPHVKEQEKVANCLSSIDDRITSQIEKIEALKTHKKGLMQGLFPDVAEVV